MTGTKITYRFLLVLTIGSILNACIEPFEIENQDFESALVVNATITDEEKRQEILLSRAYQIDSTGPVAESGAQVKVMGDDQTEYTFLESEPGTYLSSASFGAKPGVGYSLLLTTADGRSYTSDTERTPDRVMISNLYVERENNDLGEEGVSILLDNTAATGDPKYFKYEYEETYKIVAPEWTPLQYDIIDDDVFDDDGYQVGLKEEEEPRQVCYKTESSIDIQQVSTAELNTNEIIRFPARFISKENYIISHRYSILVRQYSQTPKAYFYFQKLEDFSSSESVFTDIQAGFLEGNIRPESTGEKVVGYFEVAAIDERRVYFNYSDLFPGEALPNYPVTCELELDIPLYSPGFHITSDTPDGQERCDAFCESPLINAIRTGDIEYFQTKPGFEGYADEELSRIAPFLSKAIACLDCRALGTNLKPSFWVDE